MKKLALALVAVATLGLAMPAFTADAQAATTVTRALAVGEVRHDDLRVVIVREARVGLLLGAILGTLAFVPVWLFTERSIAVVVSVTLLSVCTLAAFAGSVLPLLARRIGVDPAVISAPFITTLVDATGLVIYFLVAGAVLGL